MPEIRLGAGENLVNVNLGSIECEEVRLGTVLVWRNNILPFFGLTVNGTLVSTNGSPAAPVDPVDAANAVLTTFLYTDVITVSAMNIIDEDMQYPVTASLYEGDFDLDDTLPPVGGARIMRNANESAAFSLLRGPQPTGANAASFIRPNILYSVVAEDSEEGISIQYFRITVTDAPDTTVTTAYANVGAGFNARTSTTSQGGLTTTINTQCFDPVSTTITFTRTTTQPVIDFNQTRTCTRTIVGVVDATNACVGVATTRVNTQNNGGSSFTDANTGVLSFANGAFVAGAAFGNNVGGGTQPGPDINVAGVCTPPAAPNANCTATNNACRGTEIGATRQASQNDFNCAGNVIPGTNVGVGAIFAGGTPPCAGANPFFVAAGGAITTCGAGGRDLDLIRIRVTNTNRNQRNVRATGTCVDGTPFTIGRALGCPGNPIDTITGLGGPCNAVSASNTPCSAANPVDAVTCVFV